MEFLKSLAEIEYEMTHPEEEEEEGNRFLNTNYLYGGTKPTKTTI